MHTHIHTGQGQCCSQFDLLQEGRGSNLHHEVDCKGYYTLSMQHDEFDRGCGLLMYTSEWRPSCLSTKGWGVWEGGGGGEKSRSWEMYGDQAASM